MPTPTINVLLVDDHEIVREGIRGLLESAKGIKVVGEARDGEDALRLAKELEPQVVIMDIRMPKMGGLEATKKILHSFPDTKIVVLTSAEDNVHPRRFLNLGAVGYLTKTSGIAELTQAIRTVAQGQRYISPKIAQRMVLNNFMDGNKTPFDNLSDRQMQVAMLVIQGLRPKDIGKKMNLSVKTVSTYRHQIFKKLGIKKSDVGLAMLANQYGLQW